MKEMNKKGQLGFVEFKYLCVGLIIGLIIGFCVGFMLDKILGWLF